MVAGTDTGATSSFSGLALLGVDQRVRGEAGIPELVRAVDPGNRQSFGRKDAELFEQ
jgi:hypothetical protein